VLKAFPPGAVEAVYGPETHSPLWDPFNHPQGHKGAPKAFFQAGGLDPLRDEAILYDRVLREAGVLTRFELYSGYGRGEVVVGEVGFGYRSELGAGIA
jgi:acetyl esterase/lipase